MFYRFIEASEKCHNTVDATMRNHQASIKNIEAQLGQIIILVNEWLPPKNPDNKPQPHVMPITTKEDTIFNFLVAFEEETKQPKSQPKRTKIKKKIVVETPSSRCKDSILTTWSQSR